MVHQKLNKIKITTHAGYPGKEGLHACKEKARTQSLLSCQLFIKQWVTQLHSSITDILTILFWFSLEGIKITKAALPLLTFLPALMKKLTCHLLRKKPQHFPSQAVRLSLSTPQHQHQ